MPALHAADHVITKAMIGHWEGSAQIIVVWCKQQVLPVSIDIHADGSVTGKVGDAELARGQLTQNRGWLGRKLNLATDYIITGDLKGSIVAAEGISREAVSIPVNFANDSFTGSVHSSGSKVGGKESMILSARSLELIKNE